MTCDYLFAATDSVPTPSTLTQTSVRSTSQATPATTQTRVVRFAQQDTVISQAVNENAVTSTTVTGEGNE